MRRPPKLREWAEQLGSKRLRYCAGYALQTEEALRRLLLAATVYERSRGASSSAEAQLKEAIRLAREALNLQKGG